jgi:hypothetical protein
MKIKAIIASLVLGSSSLAMASPAAMVIRDHRPVVADDCAPAAPAQPVYSQPAYSQPVYTQPIVQPVAWHQPAYRSVTLASGLRFANQGRAFINVGSQAGRFGALQISAASGRTMIKDVVVQFADGQRQIVRNLNRTLVGNERLDLDLDGGRRAIRQIIVTGTELNNGWHRSAGGFTVTAA